MSGSDLQGKRSDGENPATVTSVLLGPVERTDRGFQVIRFEDRNEQKCSLQQSSLADFEQPGTSAVWLGVGNARMHLDLARVRQIHELLGNWIRSGMFDDDGKDDAGLLPCPFCGKEATTGVTKEGGHYAECEYCGASSALVYPCGDPPEPLVRERWNRRA